MTICIFRISNHYLHYVKVIQEISRTMAFSKRIIDKTSTISRKNKEKMGIGYSQLLIFRLRLASSTAILAPTHALFFTSAISIT